VATMFGLLKLSSMIEPCLSGAITLTARIQLVRVNGSGRTLSFDQGPFGDIRPSFALNVSPRVPTDRRFGLRRAGSRIYATIPKGAESNAVYLYFVQCTGLAFGSTDWESLTSNVLDDPSCGANERWSVMVGAPGYALAVLT